MADINKIVKSLGFIEEFVNVTSSLSAERDVNKLLDKVIQSACRFTNCDGGRIYMLDVTRQRIELASAYWKNKNCQNHWFSACTLVDQKSSGISATTDSLIYAITTGQRVIIDNIDNYPYLNKKNIYLHDHVNGVTTQAFMMVPLVNHQQETIGILELINPRAESTAKSSSNANKSNQLVCFDTLSDVIVAFAAQATICINNLLLIDNNDKLIDILDSTNKALASDNERLRGQKRTTLNYKIIGESKPMKAAYKLMDKVLDSSVSVLLRGETGTGKEVFAREIHNNSCRKINEFVSQNCAALPENLLESELFGFKKGAFTGATADKKGLFDIAGGGTLFLDEIGDMPLALQAKLLRVLQEGEIRPLGSLKSHKIDVRVIAATHCNLEEKIKHGEFREDLYFRLSVYPITLPPLRQRGSDIILLANHFIDLFVKHYKKEIANISPSAIELLVNYDFPGNVRELQNLIERAVLICDEGGSIFPDHFNDLMRQASINAIAETAADSQQINTANQGLLLPDSKTLKNAVNDFERDLIEQYLCINRWNQTNTAKALNIPRRTLIDKMKRFSIKKPLQVTGF